MKVVYFNTVLTTIDSKGNKTVHFSWKIEISGRPSKCKLRPRYSQYLPDL